MADDVTGTVVLRPVAPGGPPIDRPGLLPPGVSRRQWIMFGVLAIPATALVRPEQQYIVVGSSRALELGSVGLAAPQDHVPTREIVQLRLYLDDGVEDRTEELRGHDAASALRLPIWRT